MLKVSLFLGTGVESKKFGYDLKRFLVSIVTTYKCFGNSMDAPFRDAGDVQSGRSMPPAGGRFFEIQVEIVGKPHQTILHL